MEIQTGRIPDGKVPLSPKMLQEKYSPAMFGRLNVVDLRQH
jgi:hypothetical protein